MIWRLLAAGVLMCFLSCVLSEIGFKGKRAIGGLAIVIFALAALDGAADMLSAVMELAEGARISEAARCALKVVGVGYAFGITSDVAEELGERGLSAAVTNVGRVEIFLIVFPYFKEILNMGIGLIK